MPVYNKLIRDKILDVLIEKKLEYSSRVLDEKEYEMAIKAKFHEEISEFEKAETSEEIISELADILELIHAAVQLQNTSFEQLEEIRKQKKNSRGGFDKKLFLIEVKD